VTLRQTFNISDTAQEIRHIHPILINSDVALACAPSPNHRLSDRQVSRQRIPCQDLAFSVYSTPGLTHAVPTDVWSVRAFDVRITLYNTPLDIYFLTYLISLLFYPQSRRNYRLLG
jgi:hypothetical protein